MTEMRTLGVPRGLGHLTTSDRGIAWLTEGFSGKFSEPAMRFMLHTLGQGVVDASRPSRSTLPTLAGPREAKTSLDRALRPLSVEANEP